MKMSRRLSLDPSSLLSQVSSANGAAMGADENTLTRGKAGAGVKPGKRRNSLAVYSSLYAKNDEADVEQDENLTEGHHPNQQKKLVPAARKVAAASSVRPRGGALGGSLQDNMTGEFGGGASRSARKLSQRPQQGGLADPVPMMGFENNNIGMGGGGRTSMIVMQDRRDFASMEGKTIGIRRVIEFLANREYHSPISEKDLFSPTVAVFRDILMAIVSLVDPYTKEDIESKLRSAKGQWQSMVCAFFHNVRYPFNLSAKQVDAVGSANAWPKFLGALAWLVELIDVGEYRVEAALVLGNEERRNQKIFLETAYASYMQGEDAAFERVLLQLRANVEIQELELQRKVQEAGARVRDLEQELAKLKKIGLGADDNTSFTNNTGAQTVEALEREVEILQRDVRTMTDTVETWKKKREVSRVNREKDEKSLQELMKDLNEAQQRLNQEQKRLDNQILKSSDLARIASERNRLQKALEELGNEKEETSGRIWNVKQEVEQAKSTLQRRLLDLNARCGRLASGAPSTFGKSIDVSAVLENRPGSLSQFDQCQAFLSQAQDTFLAQAHQARQKSLDLEDLSKRNAEECGEIEARIEAAKKETSWLDEKHREATEKLSFELTQIEDQKREAKDALDAAYRAGMCSEAEMEVQALKRELQEQMARFADEEKDFVLATQEALSQLINYKEEVEIAAKRTVDDLWNLIGESERLAGDHLALINRRS